jgi:hypothetical protein
MNAAKAAGTRSAKPAGTAGSLRASPACSGGRCGPQFSPGSNVAALSSLRNSLVYTGPQKNDTDSTDFTDVFTDPVSRAGVVGRMARRKPICLARRRMPLADPHHSPGISICAIRGLLFFSYRYPCTHGGSLRGARPKAASFIEISNFQKRPQDALECGGMTPLLTSRNGKAASCRRTPRRLRRINQGKFTGSPCGSCAAVHWKRKLWVTRHG